MPETDIRAEQGVPLLFENPDFARNSSTDALDVKAVDAELKREKPSLFPSVANTPDFIQSENNEVSLRLPQKDQVGNTLLDVTTPTCKVCGSSNIVKNGRNRHGNGQKYRCKACGSYRVQKPAQIV